MNRLRPYARDSGVRRYITAGQDVLDRLCLLLHCRKLLGKAFDSITEQPSLGDGASRKRALSTSFISASLSQRWRSWTTMVDNRLPKRRRHDLRCPLGEVSLRAQLLHQTWIGTTLVHLFERLGLVFLLDSYGMQGRGCLAHSTIIFGCESSHQLKGF